MFLTYSSGRFVVRSDYSEKEIPKAAGCRWSPEDKFWWTDKSEIARKLSRHADQAAKEALEKIDRKIEESKKADADIEIPCPEGLAYMGFQKAGIAFALKIFGVDLSDIPRYIKGVGKEVFNADRSLSKKSGIQKENDEVSCDGKQQGVSGEGKQKTSSDMEDERVESACFRSNNNKNARTKDKGEASKGFSDSTRKIREQFQRGERTARNESGSLFQEDSLSTGIHHGVSDKNEESRDEIRRCRSDMLQSRFCESENSTSNRVGRPVSQKCISANERSEENGSSGSVGMESDSYNTQVKGGNDPSRGGVLIADEMG